MKKIFRVSFSAYFSSWVRPVYLFRLMTNHGMLLFHILMGCFESANLLAASYKQSYPSDPFSLCFCIGYIPFL
ncbi:hypothetical protein LEP1GSC168_4033 [Leptospira santarosai str. HAI134]|nr:hypothetical protein LEP1GSC168_4033 [Leptospira santarosai str. HAI134]